MQYESISRKLFRCSEFWSGKVVFIWEGGAIRKWQIWEVWSLSELKSIIEPYF